MHAAIFDHGRKGGDGHFAKDRSAEDSQKEETMTRTPVDSSNIHSVGHDATGLEVQFHRTGCAKRQTKKGDDADCNCSGGECYHYAGVPAEVHEAMLKAPSVASYFHSQVKSAKNSEGGLKYPAVKRSGPDYTGI